MNWFMGSTMARCPLALFAVLAATPGLAADLPTREATCTVTAIARLEHRLQDGPSGPFIPGSGSAVTFANGAYQVSYDELPEIQASRVGDPVTLCLIRIPRNCPSGDARGRIYTATNMRTMRSWTMPNAEHSCGGA